MAKELKKVTVKGAGDDRKVVLWERNEQHPNGEAFITNSGKSYEVAETAMVKRLMGEGALVEGSLSKQDAPKGDAQNVPPLRDATPDEERNAGLTTETERETARVPEQRNKK